MTNEVKILTNCDDWEALFVNGKLVDQQHKIRIQDLVQYNPMNLERVELSNEGCEWLYDHGSFDYNMAFEEAVKVGQ